jgi:hypothetical protein
MSRYRVARMQTNTAWRSPRIGFRAGSPPGPVDIQGWELSGLARSDAQSIQLDGTSGRLLVDDSGRLVIFLSTEDCAALGAGRIDIEVLRIVPEPQRPLLRFAITNHDGLA